MQLATLARTFGIAVLGLGLQGCPSPAPKSNFPTPDAATQVAHRDLSDIWAYQTDFTLNVRYPSNVAYEHYSKVIGHPWHYCIWGGKKWESFIDATTKPHTRVHQQLHMWVDPKGKRTLALSMQYRSNQLNARDPDNDSQWVALVEYVDTDVKETIKQLKLSCPPEVHAAL